MNPDEKCHTCLQKGTEGVPGGYCHMCREEYWKESDAESDYWIEQEERARAWGCTSEDIANGVLNRIEF